MMKLSVPRDDSAASHGRKPSVDQRNPGPTGGIDSWCGCVMGFGVLDYDISCSYGHFLGRLRSLLSFVHRNGAVYSWLVDGIASPLLIRCRPTQRDATDFFCQIGKGPKLFTISCVTFACCSDYKNMEFGAIINTISGKTLMAWRSPCSESVLVIS